MKQHNQVLRGLENEPFYKMLLELSKNLIEVVEAIKEIVGADIKKAALKNEAQQVEEILEELESAYAAIVNESYDNLIMKQIYETIDPLIADIDDLIEDLNEYGETIGKSIPYVEAWDIGFFYE